MFLRQIAIIDWPNDTAVDFLDITTRENPVSTQGRKPLNWVKRHAWIAPRTAGVVNADRFVDFDLAVHRFGRRERDLAERNPEVGVQFTGEVNLARIVGDAVSVSILLRWAAASFPYRRTIAILLRVHSCPSWLKKAMRGKTHG